MSVFEGIRIIDTMVGVPKDDAGYSYLEPLLMGSHTKDVKGLPVTYMFKDAPTAPKDDEGVRYILGEMDKFGVEQALVTATDPDSVASQAIRNYPDRFRGVVHLNPNEGMAALRLLDSRVQSGEVIAASFYPAFSTPQQVPINDKRAYPIYAKCAELGVPLFISTGVPGPRVPMMAQSVELLDEVCWFFPELTIIMRHGGEPWTELAVKLMLKWPNLYYSTSGFAPKHYPKAIVEYANTRGSDRIMYAGYFPIGLTYERIFGDMPNVGFKQEVWPKFLRENAASVLNLES